MIHRRRWFQVRVLAAGRERSAVRQLAAAGVGALLLLTGCGAAIPVVAASNYVAAQTAMAYAPDSLDKETP